MLRTLQSGKSLRYTDLGCDSGWDWSLVRGSIVFWNYTTYHWSAFSLDTKCPGRDEFEGEGLKEAKERWTFGRACFGKVCGRYARLETSVATSQSADYRIFLELWLRITKRDVNKPYWPLNIGDVG